MGRRGAAVFVAVAAGSIACGGGGGPREPVDADVSDAEPGAEACLPGDCPDGQLCVHGACVDPLVDRDRDGIGETVDCDDDDPAVGLFGGPRPCTTSCSDGVETCALGVWECACEDECAEGELRDLPCGACGRRPQRCAAGRWVDDGPCADEVVEGCEPGAIDEAPGPACGRCGRFERRSCRADCSWESWSVCGHEGDCSPTEREEEFTPCTSTTCGSERVRVRECDAACGWEAWSDPSECLAGGCTEGAVEEESQACGTCGAGLQSRSRTCPAACSWGSWGSWSACEEGSVECLPSESDVDAEPCGACAGGVRERVRFCDGTCRFGSYGDWGPCEGATGCSPGSTDLARAPCGPCGSGAQTRARLCEEGCAWGGWGTWSACLLETGCVPGATDTEDAACGGCGEGTRSRARECDASCAWGAWGAYGACSGGGGCDLGDTQLQAQACGACGARDRRRSCGSGCAWGSWSAWGACTGEGACVPGTGDAPRARSCGRCDSGTQTSARVCEASCAWGAWGAWGACTGELGCAPGATDSGERACPVPGFDEMMGCGLGTTSRTRSCDASCAWGSWSDWGACAGDIVCTDPCTTACPGETRAIVSGCAGGGGGGGGAVTMRSCTCSAAGTWVSCGACTVLGVCE